MVVEPEGGAVAPGGTVTLTCEAPTQPSSQIHWIKDVSDLKRGWEVDRYIIGNWEGRELMERKAGKELGRKSV